jgi:hypothetical protein
MRSGMLKKIPPVQIESIFVEIKLFLHRNSRFSEEGGKIRGHRMGEVDRPAERP